jgi:hypothetical protein
MLIKKRDIDVIVTLIETNSSNEEGQSNLGTSFNTSEIPDDISSKFDLEMSSEGVNATVTLMVSILLWYTVWYHVYLDGTSFKQ